MQLPASKKLSVGEGRHMAGRAGSQTGDEAGTAAATHTHTQQQQCCRVHSPPAPSPATTHTTCTHTTRTATPTCTAAIKGMPEEIQQDRFAAGLHPAKRSVHISIHLRKQETGREAHRR